MTLPREVDAVVIGAGPNGLVAANRLADALTSSSIETKEPSPSGWTVMSTRALPTGLQHDPPLCTAISAFLLG
jgi:succinate dehydrogenase/fumarate reductase flavoprotein subunit